MLQTRINTGFLKHFKLFKLNRSRWLTGQIVEYAVNSLNFINNTIHNPVQYFIRNLCGLCCHKVNRLHCSQCHCIIVCSEIAHNAYASHIGKSCKVLVRYPGWFFAILNFISFCCLINFFTVNEISILHNANFLFSNFADNTDSKSRSREWLTEYQFLWNSKLQVRLRRLVLLAASASIAITTSGFVSATLFQGSTLQALTLSVPGSAFVR